MGMVIVEGRGQFGGEFGASHCNQWGLCSIIVRERCILPKLLWGGLLLYKFEQKMKYVEIYVFSFLEDKIPVLYVWNK